MQSSRLLGKKLDFAVTDEVWLTPRQVTREVRLRELQWKIVHNLYPTNILLCKMKVCDSRNCDLCTEVLDTMEHFFFQCSYVRQFWKCVEERLSIALQEKITLTQTDVLFGLHHSATLSASNWQTINHVLLIGKMCISKKKKAQNKLCIERIFVQETQLRKLQI